MIVQPDITASIVIYREEISVLQKAIDSFLGSPFAKKIFLIDNSPDSSMENHFQHPKIQYLSCKKNLGFARGHNFILQRLQQEESDFHLVLNPDVTFNPNIFNLLILELQKDLHLSLMAPRVLFPDNRLQYTARRYPTVKEMILRILKVSNELTKKQEFRHKNLGLSLYPDFIHGCFMLFKTKDFLELNGFDERFFMYMEDVDICRRIDQHGKRKMYYPKVSIQHEFRKGSSKNLKLFFVHLSSAIKYYKKWGL